MVSWKDAADSHDSVASDALVIPMSSGRPDAGLPPSETMRRLSVSKRDPLDELTGQHVGVTGLDDRDATQHLTDDDLDVLVVDLHTLAAVHLLHLRGEVLLHLAGAEDAQHGLGVDGTHDQLLTDLDVVALSDQQTGRRLTL